MQLYVQERLLLFTIVSKVVAFKAKPARFEIQNCRHSVATTDTSKAFKVDCFVDVGGGGFRFLTKKGFSFFSTKIVSTDHAKKLFAAKKKIAKFYSGFDFQVSVSFLFERIKLKEVLLFAEKFSFKISQMISFLLSVKGDKSTFNLLWKALSLSFLLLVFLKLYLFLIFFLSLFSNSLSLSRFLRLFLFYFMSISLQSLQILFSCLYLSV